ncbi:RDD family protein [Bacillus paralicheniformis]|nr:RDD family protein [Bacillus paralicheniformis]MCY8149849.1 RDD family protein [Bacillus paralicheniformis]MCY8178502.1 RDD family protein [Bacillus paralicheniformis]MCY9419521.1 RDD family protein [Bacillus paralicheniformis]MEC0577941.1 RDD family protein [Bacillus paralicheniformis]
MHIGKALFRIRIISDDTGRRMKLWQAFVHYFVSWVMKTGDTE